MQAIQITDGRTSLWQWDTGVRIKVYGCTDVDQMHFVTPGGIISRDLVDGECGVPDTALQAEGLLKMYAFDRTENGGVTRCDFLLMVKGRQKPADYIDPPDEYDNLEELAKRVASLIPGGSGSVTPEQIGTAVEEYLAENPVQIEETDPTVPGWAKAKQKPTYTAEEVGAQPKGNYALKSEIPSVPVQSVNGKTGTVVLNASDVGAQPKGDYALRSDIPEILVKSVNGKTGDVVLTAQNVGAIPADAEIVDTTARDKVEANEKAVKELSQEMVKTINGVEPDENGDIQIEGGEGVAVDDTLTESGKAADAKVTGDRLATLSEEIETIKSGGETEVTLEIPVSFPDAGSNLGYINASGKMIAGTEMFQHTDPISMKAGDRLDFAVKGYRKETVILAVLAKVSGSGYIKLIDTDVATLMDYSYTADTDCQVVISYDNRTTYSGTVYATRAVGGEHYGDAAHYVNRSDNVVAIKSRYNAEEDVVVEIALAGGNMLPNPKRIYTVDKYSDAIDASLTPSRYLLNRYTDWFSPHQVRAADNADGDDIATVIFTGGNHMSNNSSSGGTVTAVCTQFDVLCDGALVENGNEKYCNSVVINITNEICGYNTWKADGTGRRILKEQIRITIGLTAKMDVEIIHTALEDVQRMRYYGLQCVNDAYTAGIQYLGGTNRALNPIDAASDCGNKTCRDGRLLSSNGDVMLTHMDEVDLGSFAYAPANDASYFATTATKAYFSLISNSGAASEVFSQSAGEQTCCRGWYDFVRE